MRNKPQKAAVQMADRQEEGNSLKPLVFNEVEEAKEGNQTSARQKSINSINELYVEVLYYYQDCDRGQEKEEAQKILDRLA